MENKDLKDFFRVFWQNELEEIKKNKIRVVALIIFSLAATFFMLSDEEEQQIILEDNPKIEQVEKNEKVSSSKNVITVRKDNSESEPESKEKNISVVIGANSDELYIGDPFAIEEEVEVAMKKEVTEIPATPPQLPQLPQIPDQLPPIPLQIPVLPEISSASAEDFILTGTAIGVNKNAIVKKISTIQGKTQEEEIIVEIGDYVQGRQIVDITDESLIFKDNEKPMYISGFSDLSVNLNTDEREITAVSEGLPDVLEENEILENPQFEENLTKKSNTSVENEIKVTDRIENLDILEENLNNIQAFDKKIQTNLTNEQ